MNRNIKPAELRQWLKQGRDTQILGVRKKADFDLDPKMLPGHVGWIRPRSLNGALTYPATLRLWCTACTAMPSATGLSITYRDKDSTPVR